MVLDEYRGGWGANSCEIDWDLNVVGLLNVNGSLWVDGLTGVVPGSVRGPSRWQEPVSWSNFYVYVVYYIRCCSEVLIGLQLYFVSYLCSVSGKASKDGREDGDNQQFVEAGIGYLGEDEEPWI